MLWKPATARLPTRKPSLLLGLGLGLGVLVISVYYAGSILGADLDYLQTKTHLARVSDSPEEAVESLSGIRLGEIRFVLQAMRDSPQSAPLGAGLGSMAGAISVVWKLPPWLSSKHYLHSGLNEVLYRTGIAGLALFIGLLGLIFRRGYQLHTEGNTVGAFLLVSAANGAVLMSFACDLGTALPILALCAAGLGAQKAAAPTKSPRTVPANHVACEL